MDAFRRLMTVVLIAGAIAGLILAAIQHVTMGPLIARAERYEHAADQPHADHASAVDPGHRDDWQPSDGLERTSYTVLGTTLTGIGFAAVLFGLASTMGLGLNAARGLRLGLLAFGCCVLAPALGLPPRPPGAAAADLHTAQLWWIGTVLATTIGVWTIARAHGSWTRRIGGAFLVALPHLIGAPPAVGGGAVPADLMTTFAIASVLTQAVFWGALGSIGGWLSARMRDEPALGGRH